MKIDSMPIVFITGAGSGIGYASAKLLAQNGYSLIINGRRAERLYQLAEEITNSCNVQVLVLPFDVSDRKQVEAAINGMPDNWKQVRFLVNNAGYALDLCGIDQGNPDDWESMIGTNVMGVLYLSRMIIPLMKQTQEPCRIVNVSSIAGKETYPKNNIYCATKHALNSISDTMRMDLINSNISVSSLSPGAAETEFSLVRFKGDEQRAERVYDGFSPLKANDVAEALLFIISRPPGVNVAELTLLCSAQASATIINRK